MARANREELLSALVSLQGGLAEKEIIHQSTSFVFKDGHVFTYNEDVACRIKSPIEFEGAVKARPLIKLLELIKDESVEITDTKDKMVIDGKRKRAKVTKESEILMPLDKISFPSGKSFEPLHEDFADAITLVQDSASKDKQKAQLVCIHITPKWIEAFDNFQMTRFMVKTPVKEPVLIQASAAKNIPIYGMTEFVLKDHWMHFRNSSKLNLSCMLTPADGYKDLTPFFKIEGEKVKLPKNLADAVKPAESCSEENKDKNYILVQLKRGKCKLSGTGVTSEYWEFRDVKYQGDEISFFIAPKLLVEIATKYNEVYVSQQKLVVDGGRFRYMTRLVQADDLKKEETKTEE